MRYSLFSDVTRRRLALSYRHLGTTYRSHLQGSISPGRNFRSSGVLRSVDRKMEHVRTSRYRVALLEQASVDLKAPSFAGNNKTVEGRGGGGRRGAGIYVRSGIRTHAPSAQSSSVSPSTRPLRSAESYYRPFEQIVYQKSGVHTFSKNLTSKF